MYVCVAQSNGAFVSTTEMFDTYLASKSAEETKGGNLYILVREKQCNCVWVCRTGFRCKSG